MKAIATLLSGLPIQHVVEQNNNLSIPPSELKTEAKQKTFMKYFSFLLKSLSSFKILSQKQQMAKHIQNLKENTLHSLVNLVSANMEFGVMQCIPLVYDPNPVVRKIFVDILAKIMESTMNLDPNEMDLSKYPDDQRYTLLNTVLLKEPYHVLLGLSEAAGFSEIDEVASLYMKLFEARGVTIEMLTHFCKLEIQQTEDPATVFRRNSVSSKLLALYGKTQLKGFINSSIGEALRRVESGEIPNSFEVDPAKTEDPSANHANLKALAKLFLDLILSNESLITPSVRAECAIVSSIVQKKFPGTERMAVGGFIFLRILCPILAAPEAYDLVKITVDRNLRRGLLLVSKIIQNLSNHVFFGNKEEFMIAFNPFLNEYSDKIDKFLDAISVSPKAFIEEPSKTSKEEVVCGMRLHLMLAESMGKVEDLAIRMNPSGSLLISQFFLQEYENEELTAAAYVAGWKQSVAAINSFLTRLGALPDEEALAKAKSYTKSVASDVSKQNNGYQELLQLIKSQKMFYISPKNSLVIAFI
jgi:GTPase-activator protein for Ras-like GTPase